MKKIKIAIVGKLYKVKNFVVKIIQKPITLITVGLTTAYNTVYLAAAGISGNVKNASGGFQKESVDILDGLGIAGVVVCGFVWFKSDSKMAKNIAVCLAGGYFLVRYANEIWSFLTGIMK